VCSPFKAQNTGGVRRLDLAAGRGLKVNDPQSYGSPEPVYWTPADGRRFPVCKGKMSAAALTGWAIICRASGACPPDARADLKVGHYKCKDNPRTQERTASEGLPKHTRASAYLFGEAAAGFQVG
jgi:hypothetical protein